MSNRQKIDTKTSPAKTVLSENPAQAIQDMMNTIDALRRVYVEETLALKAADTQAFLGLQGEKIEHAQRYHDSFKEFIARKDEILRARPDAKKLFGRKQEEFSELARENMEALSRMNRVTDRLGQRIMTVARDTARRESVAYGAGGNMYMQRNRPVTTGINESA